MGLDQALSLSLMLKDGHKFWKKATEKSKKRELEKKASEAYENLLQQMNKLETEFHQKDILHQQEIKEIQKREDDKRNLLKWQIIHLKWDKQHLRNKEKDCLIQLKEMNEKKLKLEQSKTFLEENCNRLRQERDNAIKRVEELQNQKGQNIKYSDMSFSSQFSSSDLQQATENFSDSLKIGKGGFGCVYKGSLLGTTVAIKKFNANSIQGVSQFQKEVAILTKFRHPNLVNLIGSSSEISALVYEFMPNGSLEDHLVCANNTPSLTWQARTCIISEICLALVFLHSNKPNLVIHGDLKPENILLDSNFVSKLGDFSFSRIIKQPHTDRTAFYCTTHPAGTIAYIDPQFLSSGEFSTKSDVYSFGIVALRLLTGKPPLNIASKVQQAIQNGRLHSIVDQSAGKWPLELAEKIAKLGLKCADMFRKRRPDMIQVWSMIKPLVKIASQSSPLLSAKSTFNEELVPSHFICPILQETMNDPCIAADGFTYETEAIKRWLNTGHNTSPMTNLVLPHRDLIPNRVLRAAIQEWLDQRKS